MECNRALTSIKKFHVVSTLVIGCAVLLHILTINFAPVNLEFAFVAGSRYFESFNPDLTQIYFHYQANTLGVPFSAYLLHYFFPWLDGIVAVRLASILAIPLLGYAIVAIGRHLSIAQNSIILLLLVTLFNPLIFIYSGRATADFLPLATGLAAIALLISRPHFVGMFASAVLLGCAIALKYHAVVFLICTSFYMVLDKNISLKRRVMSITWYSSIALIPVVVYLIWLNNQFGFWVTPPKYQKVLQLPFQVFAANIFAYAAYVILILLPFSFILLCRVFQFNRVQFVLLLGVTLLCITIGVFVPNAVGEMNFGPFDQFLTKDSLSLISGVCLAMFGYLFFLVIKGSLILEKRNLLAAMVCSVLIFLFLLSFTRPAQRYLIFLLPFMYILLFRLMPYRANLWATIIVLPIWIFCDAYIKAQHYLAGEASQKVVIELKEKSILGITHPGVITGHAGNYFFNTGSGQYQYIVVSGGHPKAILTSEENIGNFLHKRYSVIPFSSQP